MRGGIKNRNVAVIIDFAVQNTGQIDIPVIGYLIAFALNVQGCPLIDGQQAEIVINITVNRTVAVEFGFRRGLKYSGDFFFAVFFCRCIFAI